MCESQVAKFEITLDRRFGLHFREIFYRGLDGQDRIHALQAGHPPLIEINDIAQRNQRPDQAKEIHVKDGEVSNGHRAVHHQRHASPEDQHKADADQKLQQRAHQGVNAHQAEIALGIL